jgi:hypothetical protein
MGIAMNLGHETYPIHASQDEFLRASGEASTCFTARRLEAPTMRLPHPRFTMRWLIVAVAIAGFLFAALRYDIGMRGYVVFLSAFAAFAVSALVACKVRGNARIAALTVAALSCLAGWASFLYFGVR